MAHAHDTSRSQEVQEDAIDMVMDPLLSAKMRDHQKEGVKVRLISSTAVPTTADTRSVHV
jgi:hypothetical protein